MDIDSDEFKKEICDLTDDDCVDYSCRVCHVAKEHVEEVRIETQADELKNFTVFSKSSAIGGVLVHVNNSNVIAKTDITILKNLQNQGIISNKKVVYNPHYLIQYQKQLNKLRSYNKLPIPDEIYIETDKPAAFVWGGVVYCIAPRIESGE